MFQRKWIKLVAVLALAACSETAFEVIAVEFVEIDASTTTLLPGTTVQLTARAHGSGEVLTRTITFTSSNNAIATVSPTGLVTTVAPGTVTITAAADGTSATRDLAVNFPVPTVTSVAPTSIPFGVASTLTVRGTGFFPGTVVRVNGTAKTTTFVSNTEVRAAIAAGDFTAPSTAQVTVFNPTPGGGASAAASLAIRPANPCLFVQPYTIGSTVNGTIDTLDCNPFTPLVLFEDYYSFTLANASALTLTLTSGQFTPSLIISDATNTNDVAYANVTTGPPAVSFLRLLSPARTFTAVVGPANNNGVGNYTFSSTLLSTVTVANCDDWWTIPGIVLTQTVTSGDCNFAGTGGVFFSDQYHILPRAGQTITITLESTAFDAFLLVLDPAGNSIRSNDNGAGGTNARIVFTPTQAEINAAGYFVIDAGPNNVNATGAYILTIN